MTHEPEARSGQLGLRVTYCVWMPEGTCTALLRSVGSLAEKAHLDAGGLREDLAELVHQLRLLRNLGHYGPHECIVSAAAQRAIVALFPRIEDTRTSRYWLDAEGKGFRWGQRGGLSAEQGALLDFAALGPYEAMLQSKSGSPEPEEHLAACAAELEWLGGAFEEIGDEELAGTCREVGQALAAVGDEIPRIIEVAERFERLRDLRRLDRVEGSDPDERIS